jgi:two-component system, chemotaxis family, chemotaxis protein CheY
MTERAGIRGKIILIVDDSVAIRKQVRAILEKDGCIVREAGSEIGMLNALEEYGKKAQLVLMDLNLSTANGFDLIGRMRSIEAYRDIPVMILTEHADKENVAIARLAGVKGYLVKPIDPALLTGRIGQVLAGPS